jgi:hypothetical protein
MGFGEPDMLPERIAAVGTVVNEAPNCRLYVPSQLPKKKSLLRRMGPPIDPPNWLSMYYGLP